MTASVEARSLAVFSNASASLFALIEHCKQWLPQGLGRSLLRLVFTA